MGFAEKFEEIRKDRMGVVNSSVYPGIKSLVSEIYPDEAHFIYELLQNAEDAGATEVFFEVNDRMLIFRHNGTKQFDARDVDNITNIGQSGKTDNYVQAGKFGIGFKSVYAFTETPHIYCDTINFKIEKLLLPTEIEQLKDRRSGWTEFHFPFDSPKISADEARQKIKQGLLEIENTTLLFLNNIMTINYTLEDGTAHRVQKAVKGNMVIAGVYSENKQCSRSIWKRFTRQTLLHGKKISVDLAFPMEVGNDSNTFRFIPGQDKVCITFLAKNEKSNLKFFVNAPFGCTPARDTVNKEDKDNLTLMDELAELAKETLETLKQENMLTDDFFDILPIEDDEIPQFYEPLVNAFRDAFDKKSYLPTMNDGYVTIGNGIMSSRNVIDKVFYIKDVRTLYGNNNLQFVKNRPVNSRGYKFLKMLNIEELTPDNVLIQMTKCDEDELLNWISKLDDKQLSEVYSYLLKGIIELKRLRDKYRDYADYYCEFYANNSLYKENYQNAVSWHKYQAQLDSIQALCIVKDSKGEFYRAKDIRILIQKIDIPDDYKIVAKSLILKEESLEFLKELGAKEFTEKELDQYLYSQETRDFISTIKSLDSKDDPIDVARMILKFLKTHKVNEVDFSSLRYVWAREKTGNEKISSPTECYLDLPFGEETGFRFAESIHNKKSLSTEYLRLNSDEFNEWIDFLKNRGIYYKVHVERKTCLTFYQTGYHYDYEVPYLDRYIKLENKSLNHHIWKCLLAEDGWKYYYSFEKRKLNKFHSEHTEDSSVLKVLKQSVWILDNSGKLRLPANISESNIAKDWEVNEDNGFLAAIDFGAEKKRHDEVEKKKQESIRLQQVKEREAAVTLGFKSAEEVIAAKENAQMVTELEAMGVDIREIYNSKKKERIAKKSSPFDQLGDLKENEFRANEVYNDGDVFAIRNPERRTSKIKSEIAEEKEPSKKTIIVKKTSINQQEKLFVETEYSGRCQICNKVIYKKDGSRYSEATNLLDTGHLEEKYLAGLSTGWNTLCLCPNCAAEYKYGAVSMHDFKNQVKSSEISGSDADFFEFNIEMQGENRVLHYTPRHLLSLKSALEYFEENNENA